MVGECPRSSPTVRCQPQVVGRAAVDLLDSFHRATEGVLNLVAAGEVIIERELVGGIVGTVERRIVVRSPTSLYRGNEDLLACLASRVCDARSVGIVGAGGTARTHPQVPPHAARRAKGPGELRSGSEPGENGEGARDCNNATHFM